MSGPDVSSALPARGGTRTGKAPQEQSPEGHDSWRGASVLIKESSVLKVGKWKNSQVLNVSSKNLRSLRIIIIIINDFWMKSSYRLHVYEIRDQKSPIGTKKKKHPKPAIPTHIQFIYPFPTYLR